MRTLKRTIVILAVGAALAMPQLTLAADKSQAMAQAMRHMDPLNPNPGMTRAMETGMGKMDQSPPFQMPPVHP